MIIKRLYVREPIVVLDHKKVFITDSRDASTAMNIVKLSTISYVPEAQGYLVDGKVLIPFTNVNCVVVEADEPKEPKKLKVIKEPIIA